MLCLWEKKNGRSTVEGMEGKPRWSFTAADFPFSFFFFFLLNNTVNGDPLLFHQNKIVICRSKTTKTTPKWWQTGEVKAFQMLLLPSLLVCMCRSITQTNIFRATNRHWIDWILHRPRMVMVNVNVKKIEWWWRIPYVFQKCVT